MEFKDHIYYAEFYTLLNEYRNAATREEQLIKHKLDSIVALYDGCGVEERQFADEIMLEFSRIIALLKNQHQKELLELTKKGLDGATDRYLSDDAGEKSPFEYDREILEAFYNYFKGDYPLLYHEIAEYGFESNEDRKGKVNLTIWDYCNRIKTFSYKYLYEIFPEEAVPSVIHGEYADDYETYENVVFTYENLEMIIAKIRTTDENGEPVKQRLNIRSALRKLNEFKRATESR